MGSSPLPRRQPRMGPAFQHPSACCVSDVMESAAHAGSLLCCLPADFPTADGLRDVGLGDLTFQNASAKTDDLQTQPYVAKILGHPVLFRLGEEVFNQVAVDIDYPHRRLAFRDPRTVTKPAGAIEVPLSELDGERVLPLSVDSAAPAQFELELGNVIGPLMVTLAYAQTQKPLEGHPTSQRLSGRYSETVVSVDHPGLRRR
jgi:hypothetical protein